METNEVSIAMEGGVIAVHDGRIIDAYVITDAWTLEDTLFMETSRWLNSLATGRK